jgi:hypothetical protein
MSNPKKNQYLGFVAILGSVASAQTAIDNPRPACATNCLVQNPTASPQVVSGKVNLTGDSSARTFQNPELYIPLTDDSPATSNPGAQGDFRVTPVEHIEINDIAPNNAIPIYAAHNCNYRTGPANANGACVAMLPIVTSTPGDEHAGLEAINAIVQVGSTDPLAQAQGIELNMFNNSGADSNLLPNSTFSRGPYLGISSTAGGGNPMVAAFAVQDQRAVNAPHSGWHHGFWVPFAYDDGVLVGYPGGGGPPIGLHQAATCSATATANCSSIPLQFDSSYSDGSASHPFATQLYAYSPPGFNQAQCLAVSFTSGRNVFSTCSNGNTTEGHTTVNGPLVINNQELFIAGAAAGVEVGDSATTAPYIDLHSSGNTIDYDARIQVTGGTSAVGQGTIDLIGSHIATNGVRGLTHTVKLPCGTITFTNGLLTGVSGTC